MAVIGRNGEIIPNPVTWNKFGQTDSKNKPIKECFGELKPNEKYLDLIKYINSEEEKSTHNNFIHKFKQLLELFFMGATVYFVYKIDTEKTRSMGELVLEPAHESIYGLSEKRAFEIREQLQNENPNELYIVKSRYIMG